MKSWAEQVERALAASNRLDVLWALSPRRPELLLPDIIRLTAHLKQLDEHFDPLRIAIIRTYTTELLRPYWTFESLLEGFHLDLYEAPFGSLVDESKSGSELCTRSADVVYFLLQWDDLDPRFARPLVSLSLEEQDRLAAAALDRLESILHGYRSRMSSLLVFSLLPRLFPRAFGLHDPMAANSEAGFLAALKGRIAARLREGPGNALWTDLDEVAAEVGKRRMYDPRLWFTSCAPFAVAGSQAVVRHLIAFAKLAKRPRSKCILLDADNTLWGGVVGEDGLEGIEIGPEYPGSTFVAFQRRLLDFQERGLLLALCSKNNSDDVLEVLRNHPHQVLREGHFAAIRANWESKADNVRAIAGELNLGTDSLVFVDDSPHECLALSKAIPEMTVVQLPAEPVDIPFCLDELTQLEVLSLTEEDRNRTSLYAGEHARKQHSAQSWDPEQYLRSLQMVMTVSVNDRSHIPRLAQLTQKTNQFNLTTRRYNESEIRQFMEDSGSLVADFSLTDIFGDSGIVGLAIVTWFAETTAVIGTFLMSCRVIGRRAETAFLRQLLELLAEQGAQVVRATYIPTQKNLLVKDFWKDHGFRVSGPDRFEKLLSPSAGTGQAEGVAELTKIEAPTGPFNVVLKKTMPARQSIPARQSAGQ